MRGSTDQEAKYGDCSESELVAICDRLGFRGPVRAHWVELFKLAAHHTGTSRVAQSVRDDLDFFIREGRNHHQPCRSANSARQVQSRTISVK
jgi:hypothetical protein